MPGKADSASLEEMPEPSAADGSVLVRAYAVGVCGTDREILGGGYGEAPPGQTRLILGHESVGRVLAAPHDSGLRGGDWVAGIVRRPDPVPCTSCAVGEWDMCRNGRYTERGIKALHGFASERYRLEPDFATRVEPELGELGVLVEPASVVATGAARSLARSALPATIGRKDHHRVSRRSDMSIGRTRWAIAEG